MSRTPRQAAALLALLAGITFGAARPCSATSLNVLADIFAIQAGTGTTLLEQNLLYIVPRFDPSLGILDAVSIMVIRGAASASVTVDSESPFFAAVFADSVTAVAFTTVSYLGGQLVGGAPSVDLGPTPGMFLPPDSDGTRRLYRQRCAHLYRNDPGSFDRRSTHNAWRSWQTLRDQGLLLLTLEIRRLSGSTIPGIQWIQAGYGPGIGLIGVNYEYTPATPIPSSPSRGRSGWWHRRAREAFSWRFVAAGTSAAGERRSGQAPSRPGDARSAKIGRCRFARTTSRLLAAPISCSNSGASSRISKTSRAT